jgi:hypothetical protein
MWNNQSAAPCLEVVATTGESDVINELAGYLKKFVQIKLKSWHGATTTTASSLNGWIYTIDPVSLM